MATQVAEKGRLAAGKEPRGDKVEAVEELHKQLTENSSLVLFDYRGLGVDQMTTLRRRTREAGVRLTVVKNSLVERAVAGTDFEVIQGRLAGPVSIVTTEGDPAVPAKVLKNFLKDAPAGKICGGVLDGKFVEPQEVEALADLPTREELLSKLLGTLEAPVAGLPRLLNGVLAQLMNVLQAIAKGKE